MQNSVISHNHCTGCGACITACPQNCISPKNDKRGFIYPHIDTTNCIKCNVCKTVCPIYNSESNGFASPAKTYAGWRNNQSIHERSSSGGIAYTIAEMIINNGGIVYGAASEGQVVRHTRINKIEELYKIQGSKYVQSDTINIHDNLHVDLRNGKKVLFVGTPCQVAAIKKLFYKKYQSNLILIDLICHGVPSIKMLNEHILSITQGQTIQSMSFRKGSDFILELNGNNFHYESDLWKDRYKDMYYSGFISGITFRQSCFNCIFAKSERLSDITLGDFWSIQNKELLPNESSQGISLILANTPIGEEIINNIRQSLFIQERNLAEAQKGNPQLVSPFKPNIGKYIFHFIYPIIPFRYSVKISLIYPIFLYKFKNIVKRIIWK